MKTTRSLFQILLFGLTCILFSVPVHAQDPHFSQPEYSPLTLNPALAGASSPIQGTLLYRTQWSTVTTPFLTTSASFDMRFKRNRRGRYNTLAAGIHVLHDKSGSMAATSTTVNGTVAYHALLSEVSTLSVGLSFGAGQRSLNTADGQWSSQYTPAGYNAGLPSGESFYQPIYSFVDAGTGVLYSYNNYSNTERRSLNAGLSAFHVNRPTYSFIAEDNERLPMRYVAFVNGEFEMTDSRGSFLPGIYYQRQAVSSELYFGSYYKYHFHKGTRYTGFNRPSSISIGLFGRMNDAAVAKFMFEYDQVALGFAYDLNTSGLSDYSQGQGGIEFFFRFSASDGGGFRNRQ